MLKSVLRVMTMENAGYRTIKSVKNINKLFCNLDDSKYTNHPELQSYIWAIKYFSKQWLDGFVTPELIMEKAKNDPACTDAVVDIIASSINDPNIISAPEAKELFDRIANALQYGYIASMKEDYISLLDDIDLDDPMAFKELTQRLFQISQSLIDIKHSTNLVANKIQFNTNDMDSIKDSLSQTIDSLKGSSGTFITGIKRWNTLLSPGYMDGRIYIYMGLPGGGKSLMLLKSALDIRKYNHGYVPRTPGLKPCVLYVTMENTFTETIERTWNMSFDDPITNYTPEQAVEMLCDKLGISHVNSKIQHNDNSGTLSLADALSERDKEKDEANIEIVMKYFPYRSISTDDLFVIIQDLREEGLEVCALVFDYIKRIEPSTPTPDNVKLELNHIINELKALAVIQNIPVITAHQLNRAAAASVDAAVRQGKGDATKLAGRENVGDAWEIMEVGDWVGVVNIEYKPNTNDRYIVINVLKRRRIDQQASEMAKFTYLAHPFSRNNGLRLIDDINNDKVLSLESLSTDIDVPLIEKINAVPRTALKLIMPQAFEDDN